MNSSWLRRFLGLGRASVPAPRDQLAQPESLPEVFNRGGQLREVDASDLSPDFQERLREVCRADTNVDRLWLLWIRGSDGTSELLTVLQLDRADEHSIVSFAARVDALGGPRCAATIADGAPSSTPFYRRAKQPIRSRPNEEL
jgi:hypothetical protein